MTETTNTTSQVRYQWKKGSRVRIDAQLAGERFELLEQRGSLTAESVLEDALHEASPLHAAFEWSDTEAARKYRLNQARHLIRSLVVAYVEESRVEHPVRAFVSVEPHRQQGYEHVLFVMTDDERREKLIAQAWRELEQWKARYQHLTEFADICERIGEASV